MRTVVPIALTLFAAACPPADTGPSSDTDTASTIEATDPDTDEPDTDDPDTGETVVDLDQDGASPPADCDDREPRAYPGAAEVWDGVDNDCDGVVDGRGTFSGTMTVQASAIVEGQTQRRSVDCDVTFDRQTVIIAFEVVCDVPESDALARQLLGATTTVTPSDNVATDGTWSGQTVVASSDGWQATGTGAATWTSDLDGVQLSIDLVSASLRLQGNSLITRS